MTIGKEEAASIARLLDNDGKTTGWVYLWNTSQLSILWIDRDLTAKYIEPPLCPNVLAKAKSVTIDAITDLLEALSTGSSRSLD